MRPLIMDFAADKETHNIGNEYLFGHSLLVAPVTQYKAKTWPVYLPQGSDWYNFWTNEYFKGGQTIKTDTSIDMVPLYVKAGSILPFGPEVQYSTEKSGIILKFVFIREPMVNLYCTKTKMIISTTKKESIRLSNSNGMTQQKHLL